MAERQLLEIAKALLQESDILILNEPNSALNAAETERLMGVVQHLRDSGVSVLYISHRLEEVFEIADTVTVMRNGRVVETARAVEWSIEGAVRAMLGNEAHHLEERGQDPFARSEDCEPIVAFDRVSVVRP